jgi:hypothetical protein
VAVQASEHWQVRRSGSAVAESRVRRRSHLTLNAELEYRLRGGSPFLRGIKYSIPLTRRRFIQLKTGKTDRSRQSAQRTLRRGEMRGPPLGDYVPGAAVLTELDALLTAWLASGSFF